MIGFTGRNQGVAVALGSQRDALGANFLGCSSGWRREFRRGYFVWGLRVREAERSVARGATCRLYRFQN